MGFNWAFKGFSSPIMGCMCLFSTIIPFFSRAPKCSGSYRWGYAYPRLGITALPHASNISFRSENFQLITHFEFRELQMEWRRRTATRYGLSGPEIKSRSWAIFSAPVQTGPEAHPASYTTGTGQFKYDGTRVETRFRLSGETDESI